MSLAQIGEFAFVLLSRASNLHLVEVIHIIVLLLCCQAHVLPHKLTLPVFSRLAAFISDGSSCFYG